MTPNELLLGVTGFDWDDGNRSKSKEKHRVASEESEEAFFNQPILLMEDAGHSEGEPRFQLLGKTTVGRRLFVAFTLRGKKIRVISARDQSRQERRIYEEAEKNPEVQK